MTIDRLHLAELIEKGLTQISSGKWWRLSSTAWFISMSRAWPENDPPKVSGR